MGTAIEVTGIFGQGRTTALTMRDDLCAMLLRKSHEFIKFPRTEDETRKAVESFGELTTFPQVVGTVDGSHIPIK